MRITRTSETLRKNKRFRAVLGAARRGGGLFTVAMREGAGSLRKTRLGVTVSKKVDKRAVVRNRIKRRVKAAFAELEPNVAAPREIVVIAKQEAAGASYADIKRSLAYLFMKHRALKR